MECAKGCSELQVARSGLGRACSVEKSITAVRTVPQYHDSRVVFQKVEFDRTVTESILLSWTERKTSCLQERILWARVEEL